MERRNVYCVVRHQGVYTRFQKRLWLVLVRGIKKGFREEVLFEAGSLRMRMWGEGCRIMTSEEDGRTSQIHRGFKHLSDKSMACCLEYRRRIGRWCWERCQVPLRRDLSLCPSPISWARWEEVPSILVTFFSVCFQWDCCASNNHCHVWSYSEHGWKTENQRAVTKLWPSHMTPNSYA